METQFIGEAAPVLKDIYYIVFYIGALTLAFVGLGIFFAKLWWGRSVEKLQEARAESLQLSGRANEIVEDQNLLISKLKKSAATFHADLTYRDNRIQKLQGDYRRLQNDLNERIKLDNQFTGTLRNKDIEVERLQKELENHQHYLFERDEELTPPP